MFVAGLLDGLLGCRSSNLCQPSWTHDARVFVVSGLIGESLRDTDALRSSTATTLPTLFRAPWLAFGKLLLASSVAAT